MGSTTVVRYVEDLPLARREIDDYLDWHCTRTSDLVRQIIFRLRLADEDPYIRQHVSWSTDACDVIILHVLYTVQKLGLWHLLRPEERHVLHHLPPPFRTCGANQSRQRACRS